ncbi:hypothetical protein GOC16_08255 [Sinorhizobium meliloti]|nr:hypothetical protein [Sinorhizobium meliloti]
MARLPTSFDLSQPANLRSGRQIAQVDTSGLARGVAVLGESLSGIGADIQRQRTATEGIAADGGALRETNDFIRSFDEDGDYATFGKRAEQGLGQIKSKYASKITNAEARKTWEAEFDRRAEAARNRIADLGERRVRETKLVDAKTGLDGYRSVISDPNSPEEARTEARRNAEASIAVLRENGLLTPSEADTWHEEVIKGGDFVFGQREIERDPSIITGKLPARVADRASVAMARLQSKGWTKEQAAGIVGNLLGESTLNTHAVNPGDGADGSDSIGLAQWNGPRARALKQFAADQGKDWRDLELQLDFIDHEIRSSPSERKAFEALMNAKDVTSAAEAFIMYERPQGSDKGVRNAHNYKGRVQYAHQAAGETIRPDWYQNQSPERQLQLENMAAARDREIANLEAANQKASQAQAYNDYRLRIAAEDPTLTQQEIMQDTRLETGNRASLVTSYKTAQEESAGVSAFLSAISAGQASVNPYDPDQTKIADKAYERLQAAAGNDEERSIVTSDFASRSGYIPKKVQAELRRGSASNDPAAVAQSMEAASALQRSAPMSFRSFEGGDSVRKNLDLYRTYTNGMGLSPEEAGQKIVALNDPEAMRQRDAILKSEPIKKILKDVSSDDVAAIFDKGFFHPEPDVGGIATPEELKVGVNTEAEAAIVADYRGILEESIADTNGDIDAAKELANQRFSRNYGVSELSPLGSSVVIKYPPEKVYPAAPDGTHDYIRDQAVEALKAEGVNPETIYLQAYEATAQDIKAGRPARYEVFYEQDGKLERYFLPFFADFEAGKAAARSKQEQTLRDAGTRMIENRSRFASEREADQRSYDETQGSDWMKARQMQADQERRRQDEALERLLGTTPIETGQMNGGGGGGY